MKISSIEWTEVTWNPVTGCTKISAGCKNCYAERMAKRLHAMGSSRYANKFKVTLHWDLVDLPKQWARGRVIFVNSMSDLFHPEVPLEFIQAVFRTMAATPHHKYQILTKRADRLLDLAPLLLWTENIWMGVSVEDERVAWRIDCLRHVPASVRFLSIEPLIGPLPSLNLRGIDWVIVGGESGPKSRRMRSEWVESILTSCRKQKVEFFFKQWGGVRKHTTGRALNGRTYDEMPFVGIRDPKFVQIEIPVMRNMLLPPERVYE
jgi:protein gp37